MLRTYCMITLLMSQIINGIMLKIHYLVQQQIQIIQIIQLLFVLHLMIMMQYVVQSFMMALLASHFKLGIFYQVTCFWSVRA